MPFRVFMTVLTSLFFAACVDEPEPNEFSHLRAQMEKRQSYTFGDSLSKLEERKNTYQPSNGHVKVVDPDEELRQRAEEERQKWLAVHIQEDEAEDWKALGLSPKYAARWKKTGLSYSTIAVLIREDVTPSEAISFMRKKFDKNPKAFSQFAQPLFQFSHSCEKILEADIEEYAGINKRCTEYVRQLRLSLISGYLADEFRDNDLSLEYISKLRQLDKQKLFIQKQMNKQAYAAMIQEKVKNFSLLFPLLETSPSKEEMYFVKQHSLPLEETKRYKSYEYYEFWVNKEKEEEKARVAVIEQQRALKKAKEARQKAEAYRLKALAYNKMVASECGDFVTATPSTGEKVHIEGKVQYHVGKKGSNIFAYVVKNNKDGKNYVVRDPNAKEIQTTGKEVSWTALTVGRVVSLTLDDDGTASYNHYTEEGEDKEFYPMLKFVSQCPYHTKSLLQ